MLFRIKKSIQEIVFEIVDCKMVAILYRPQYVDKKTGHGI